MSDRPPFHQLVQEQLEVLAKHTDAKYWHVLKGFQVEYVGPDTLSPPKTPVLLKNQITMYAGALFRIEADQYPKNDGSYTAWLKALAKRITARVLRTVAELEASEGNAMLSYHGLSVEAMRENLEVFFAIVVFEYAGIPMPITSEPRHSKPEAIFDELSAAEPRNPRKEFVEPILDAKGWSPLVWAAEANLAYHTVADYLAGKTNPFRDTRLKMAKSLGVSVQQLPK